MARKKIAPKHLQKLNRQYYTKSTTFKPKEQ